MIVKDLLSSSTEKLNQAGVDQSKREAFDLLAFHLGCSYSDLYLMLDEELNDEVLKLYQESLQKRMDRIPMAYITKKQSFYGIDLKIDPRVLVPRCETELMVDSIAQKLESMDLNGKVLFDICTGSGCIGLSLKNKFKELEVFCSDLSDDALALAKENAQVNHLKINFKQGSYLEPFRGQKAHFIISNPPYVSEDEYKSLEPEVLKEPEMALVGGVWGVEPYEIMARSLSDHLESGGCVWFEMGYAQAKSLKEIFKNGPWKSIEVLKDLSGKDRVFFLEKE